MASLYPGGFDVLVNPLPVDPLTAPSHALNHTDVNNAVEAIQATLGLNPQGAFATVSARLATLSGAAIGSPITGATAGSVLFAGALGVLQQDNANLFWDDTNNGLGVGAAPGAQDRLHLRFTGNVGDSASEFRISRAPGTAGEANEWTVGISHPTIAVAPGSLLFRVAQTAPAGAPSDIGFLASSNVAGTNPDVIVKASGRVGIGTPSPATQLHVVNTLGIRAEETGATGRTITLVPPTIGARGTIIGSSANGLAVGVDAAGPLALRTNSLDRVTVDSTGNVGVGTTTPTSFLQLVKDVNSGFGIELLNVNAGAAAETQIALVENGGLGRYASFEYLNSGFPTTGLQTASQGKFVTQGGATGGWLFSTLQAAAPIVFGQGGIAAINEKLRINATTVKVSNAGFDVPGTIANPITINTKAFSFPAAFGAAGSVLTDAAGNGVLSWAVVGAGSGVTTMAAIGAAPNANAATIAGVTLTMQPASASFGGVLTAGTQTIAGAKTWNDPAVFSSTVLLPGTGANPLTLNTKAYNFPNTAFVAGGALTDVAGNGTLTWVVPSGGGGVTTMAAIGAVPNANGAVIAGTVLTLEPASISFGGVVSTGTQTFAGNKTFAAKVTIPASAGNEFTLNGQIYTFPAALGAAGSQLTDALGSGVLSWASPGATTMAAIGAAPNGNGAVIAGGVLTLEPASASFGGVVTTGIQTFAGAKSFTGKVTLTNSLDIPGTVANPLVINTKIYSFPAAFGTAGTVLTDAAGTGVLSWSAPTMSPNNLITFTEDFMSDAFTGSLSGLGPYQITQSGAGAAWSIRSSEANHWGICRFSTGTTATGRGGILAHNSCVFLGTTDAVYECAFRIQQLGTAGTQETTIRMGWMDETSIDPANGMYFRIDLDGTPEFFMTRKSGGLESSSATGVFAAINTWYYLRLEYRVATNQTHYFINNVNEGLLSLLFAVDVGVGLQIEKTIGITAHTAEWDYFHTHMILPTGR